MLGYVLFNPPLFAFIGMVQGEKPFYNLQDFFVVVVFYLEDEREYQCAFVSTCTQLHWHKKCQS